MLLVGGGGGVRLLLTRRSRRLRRQPGDIAFPGGMVDPGDRDELAAALREGREEIGLDPRAVRVLGRLDDRLTVERFRLSPFVGWIRSAEGLGPSREVEEIFEIPFGELPGCESAEVWPGRDGGEGRGGPPRLIFRYPWRGRDVWGLTARIIRDLLDVGWA